MTNLLILEAIFGTMIILAIITFNKLESKRLRRQALIVGLIAFVGGWAIEAKGISDGRWLYTESIYNLPGNVPIEIAAIYGLAVPLFFWLIQRTYASELDTILKFGAPEMLIVIGVIFWIADGFIWLIFFAGVAGLLVAPRKKLVVIIGLIAFLTELAIEGFILVSTGIVDWSKGYPLATPIQFMFAAWFITGYLTAPNTRFVK
jgi:hypothetical protein